MTSASPPMLKPISTAASTPAASDGALESRKVPSAAMMQQRERDPRGEEPVEEPAGGEAAGSAAPPSAETAMAARSAVQPAIGEEGREVRDRAVLRDRDAKSTTTMTQKR